MPSQSASRLGHLEADPAREQRDDELVEGDALLGGEGDELFVECGGAADQDSAVRVHAANNIACDIDTTSSACDITPMELTATPEIINTVLATQRQRTTILAPMERMNHMVRVLTINFPEITRDEAAGYVLDYAARMGMETI